MAEQTVGQLRKAGLHPVDLSLSTPLFQPGTKPAFPIEVPVDEARAALEIVASLASTPSIARPVAPGAP